MCTQVQWHTSLMSTSDVAAVGSLRVQGQHGLHSEFQVSQGHVERPSHTNENVCIQIHKKLQ